MNKFKYLWGFGVLGCLGLGLGVGFCVGVGFWFGVWSLGSEFGFGLPLNGRGFCWANKIQHRHCTHPHLPRPREPRGSLPTPPRRPSRWCFPAGEQPAPPYVCGGIGCDECVKVLVGGG